MLDVGLIFSRIKEQLIKLIGNGLLPGISRFALSASPVAFFAGEKLSDFPQRTLRKECKER
jgi:hypothetical protein